MASLYFDDRTIDVSFTCNNKLYDTFLEKEYNGVKAKVIFLVNHRIRVDCWVEDKIIFSQTVDFIYNQHYNISCEYKKIRSPLFWYEPTHDMEKESRPAGNTYTCIKELHPKVAKKWFKEIKKNNLVSKPCWDSWFKNYDWKCKCCDHSWVGNPDIGFVRETLSEPSIHYKGKHYVPCEGEEYDTLDWYNEREYEELKEKYTPKEITYLNQNEYSQKIEKATEEFFLYFHFNHKPSFEEFAEKWGYKFRVVAENGIYRIGTILPDGLYVKDCVEKVVNFEEPRFKIEYPPFRKIWNFNLPQSAIDAQGNITGGAYRSRGSFNIFSKDELPASLHNLEEVITLGWHSTKPKSIDVVECPVCRDLNKILCRSGYRGLNIFQHLREYLYFLKNRLRYRK